MKKKITLALMVTSLAVGVLAGCGGNSNNVVQNTEIVTKSTTTTEAVTTEQTTTLEETKEQATEKVTETTPEAHSHTYIEAITSEATCEAEGIKTYSCECGDSYTEIIPAVDHSFENYIFNNDATYTADGTETAKCNNCDVTDIRTAEGSMLIYTYTDMDATMYAQQEINVRNMPNTDGEKLGSLSINDEVKVTGQCAETSWYRIEYSGGVAYVSNSYLGNDKAIVEQPKIEQSVQSTSATNSNVVISAGGYTVIERNGYAVLDGPAPTSFDEACAIARALGYDIYQVHDDSWCYGLCGDGSGSALRNATSGWSIVAEYKDLDVPGGYIWLGNWYYIVRWRNHL